MPLNTHQPQQNNLFYKWVLNNKAVIALMITLLVFLTIFVFTKISFLFTPVLSFFAVIMLPVVMSTILYYLIKPLVDRIEKLGPNRTTSIFMVFGLVILLFVWAISGFIPMVKDQLTSFIQDLPKYVGKVNLEANKVLENDWLVNYKPQLQDILTTISQKALDYAQDFSKNAIDWAGNFAGAVARITVAVIISPFILFYFLRDSGKMKNGLVNVLPIKIRRLVARVLGEINKQLSGYVQGQVTVAIVVGFMFSIMFSLVGLKYSITFGIIAGFLNMIPYLGSFLAMIPVVIMGMVQGPLMLVKVLVIFTIEQTIEGRFVAPLVLGNKLSIHPISIMFLLLTAGSMFGVWGVFLAIPVYASVKVIVKEVFEWYKGVSGLYEEELVTLKEVSEDVK